MKILLITSFFYPDEHIGASRWNRLSKYLQRYGHEVYVVSSDNGKDFSSSIYCKEIIRVNSRSSLPDQILHFVNRAKKNTKLELQRQTYSAKKELGIVDLYAHIMKFLGKLARFPNSYWWSANEMVKAGKVIIQTNDIDVIVATHPFPGCLKAAQLMSSKTKIPWVADMRDGWSSYYWSEYPKGSFLNWGIVLLERYYLKKATAVVTVNTKLANSLQVDGRKVHVITNSYDSDEIQKLDQTDSVCIDNTIEFAFAGNVLDGHNWDVFLSGLAEFLELNSQVKFVINYYGSSFSVLYVQGIAAGLPKDTFIDHGYISKTQLKQELRKADFLVVFGFNGPFGNTVTTGKIFDYIEAAKPVIVVGQPDSELAILVAETGIGIIASSKGEIQNLVSDFLTNRDSFINSSLLRRKHEVLTKYTAAETAFVYSQLLNELIGSPSSNIKN